MIDEHLWAVLKALNTPPEKACRLARLAGLDVFCCIRQLRRVYGFSLEDAKLIIYPFADADERVLADEFND